MPGNTAYAPMIDDEEWQRMGPLARLFWGTGYFLWHHLFHIAILAILIWMAVEV